MKSEYFRQHHKELLREATVIAEEVTSDFFKLSPCHWRRARYDILTLEALRDEEISPHALALVANNAVSACNRSLATRPWPSPR